jgi:hypothetical protein
MAMTFGDVTIGAVFMPVMFVAILLLMLFDEMWFILMRLLDFEPER